MQPRQLLLDGGLHVGRVCFSQQPNLLADVHMRRQQLDRRPASAPLEAFYGLQRRDHGSVSCTLTSLVFRQSYEESFYSR